MITEPDLGWDVPHNGSFATGKSSLLVRWINSSTNTCTLMGTPLIFVDSLNHWDNMASSSAIVHINNILEMGNATVNYDVAFGPYRQVVHKYCSLVTASMPPMSVNIGTRRLSVELIDNATLAFRQVQPLIKAKDENSSADITLAGICYQPVTSVFIPKLYRYPGNGDVINYLSHVVPNTNDLLSIMWSIGNSIIDPVLNPRIILLVGPGGTGKSSLLRMIQMCTEGCSGTVRGTAITTKKSYMPNEITSLLVSCRILVGYDIDLIDGNINIPTLKGLTGGDFVHFRGSNIRSHCSLFLASNALPNIETGIELTTDAVHRRLVSIPMESSAMFLPYQPEPSLADQKLDFMCACVHTRLLFKHMPLSVASLVMSLAHSRFTEIRDRLFFKDGVVPNDSEGQIAVSILAVDLKCSNDEIVRRASLINPTLVVEVNGAKVIKGMFPRK